MNSFFWRNPPQQQVVMGLLRVLQGTSRPVRVLDIGAATGEVAATYAMLLRDEYGEDWHDRFAIACVEPHLPACEWFRSGRFHEAGLHWMPDEFRERYVGPMEETSEGPGFYLKDLAVVQPVVMHHARFEEFVCEDGSQDLIFCQNVLFHIPTELAEQTIARVHGMLRLGGYFVCAGRHPESASQLRSSGFRPVDHDMVRVYNSWHYRLRNPKPHVALKTYDLNDPELGYRIGSIFKREQ